MALANSYISKENEFMMCLHCKMIDLKDLNIVHKCPNQHCSSYSICLLFKFINWRCVLSKERKSMRPFFFHFRETDWHFQWHSQWNNLWAVRFTNTEECHSVNSLFLVIHFSQRVPNWSLVSEGHNCQMRIHVWDSAFTLWPRELQFFQKGNEQLHKLPVCWIWKRMN